LLLNFERIADAVETIAENFGGASGEGTYDPAMFGGPADPALVLSDEEWATIRALRTGEAVVMPSGKTHAAAAFGQQAAPALDPAAIEAARMAALPVPPAPGPSAVIWTGGPFAPVNGQVFVQRRNGTMEQLLDATAVDWQWHGDDDDICHYAPAA
jgi:hypothetical protein